MATGDNILKPGVAKIQGLIHRPKDAVIAYGNLGSLFATYLEHAKKLNILPDVDATLMMRHGMAAACLHLALHPPDEFTAWTLNIKKPPLNFFICGDNSQFNLTGRVYTRDVKITKSSRLFMESQRPKRKPTSSTLDVDGLNVLKIFEQFYERSEQIPSRLFELSTDEFVLIQGLPRVDQDWLQSLDNEDVRNLLSQNLESIEERSYTFCCGCDFNKILGVVHGIFKSQVDELFQGNEAVETACPRCGKRYWIMREDFDRGPEKIGMS
jgi:Hsp33 protein